jgi:hypothetical protein
MRNKSIYGGLTMVSKVRILIMKKNTCLTTTDIVFTRIWSYNQNDYIFCLIIWSIQQYGKKCKDAHRCQDTLNIVTHAVCSCFCFDYIEYKTI